MAYSGTCARRSESEVALRYMDWTRSRTRHPAHTIHRISMWNTRVLDTVSSNARSSHSGRASPLWPTSTRKCTCSCCPVVRLPDASSPLAPRALKCALKLDTASWYAVPMASPPPSPVGGMMTYLTRLYFMFPKRSLISPQMSMSVRFHVYLDGSGGKRRRWRWRCKTRRSSSSQCSSSQQRHQTSAHALWRGVLVEGLPAVVKVAGRRHPQVVRVLEAVARVVVAAVPRAVHGHVDLGRLLVVPQGVDAVSHRQLVPERDEECE